MLKKVVFLLVIFSALGILFQNAYAIEIIGTPEKDPFGPNDSIKIQLKIDGYQGGDVEWTAQKPDGSTESGVLSSFQASKKTHVISRSATDNLFGEWKIDYHYKDITKTVTATVEPLIVHAVTDKPAYQSGDTVVISLSTNYYEPKAAQAESYRIEIVDMNDEPVKQMDYTYVKAYQETTQFQFPIDDLLDYNPIGDYKASIQYFNTFTDVVFTAGDVGTLTSVFVGTDKSVYDPGDIVEVQLIISTIIEPNAVLKVTDPDGQTTVRSIPIETSLTRIYLDDVPTTIPGTYLLEVHYGETAETKTFVVEFETSLPQSSDIELDILLDKNTYRPGEALVASISINELESEQISYWLQDPAGVDSIKKFSPMASGKKSITHSISTDSKKGPWKFYVDYGGAVKYSIFFVEGEPVEQSLVTTEEQYVGPEVLMTLDETAAELNKPQGISVDSNGHIYVVDAGNYKIKKFDSNGRLLTSWGTFGSGEGQLKDPTGIFVDSQFVHVADTGNSRIQTFDKDGNFVRIWGNSGIVSQSLVNPVSITVDDSGISYIADFALNKISKYDLNGDYKGHIESLLTSAAKFSSANSIVSDGSDSYFILVSDDDRILQYRDDGTFVKSFGTAGEDDGKFQNPSAISIDSKGNLYVADAGNFRIQVLDYDGNFLKKWGSLGTGKGQFQTISGIAVDDDGHVYVSDSDNNRIQKFAPFDATDDLEIPTWIRNNAKWWHEGSIADADFASGIQFMIKEKIIHIPELAESGESTGQGIPDWIKKNAGWWSEGLISDTDFAKGIEFLVKEGIIQI